MELARKPGINLTVTRDNSSLCHHVTTITDSPTHWSEVGKGNRATDMQAKGHKELVASYYVLKPNMLQKVAQ